MSDSPEDGGTYFLDLHLSKIGYDKGYWATFRVFRVEPDQGRPHGWQYSLSFHDVRDGRVLGYDNSHAIDVATGPARKSKKPKPSITSTAEEGNRCRMSSSVHTSSWRTFSGTWSRS